MTEFRLTLGVAIAFALAQAGSCVADDAIASETRQVVEKNYEVGERRSSWVGESMVRVKDYWVTTQTADALGADRAFHMKLPPFFSVDIAEGAPARVIGSTERDGKTYRLVRLADPKVALLSFLLNDDGTFQGSAVNNNGTRMGFKYKPKPADVKFVGKTFTQTDASRVNRARFPGHARGRNSRRHSV